MFIRMLIVAVIMVALIPLIHNAQSQSASTNFEQDLLVLNQSPPRRSPQFKSDEEVLKTRIINANRQLIGTVDDVIVNEAGEIEQIATLVKSNVKKPRVVFNNYSEATYMSEISAYQIPIIVDEDRPSDIEADASAEALASLEPASGGRNYSVKSMVGKDVKTPDGRFMGKVSYVLFDGQAKNIKALLLQDVPGASRYKEIAVPYNDEIEFVEHFGNLEITLPYDQGVMLKEYAKTTR